MILATGEGQVVFLVIMAVIGVINWLAGKAKTAGGKTPPNPSAPTVDAPSPQRGNAGSEEERMRRFLEALGVPTEERPVPPIVAPPPIPPAPRRPARPPVVPPQLQPQSQRRSREKRSATGARVENIALPELAVPTQPEFETVSSKISVLPAEFPAIREEDERPRTANLGDTLRAALASPQQLRSAFLLSEIFGTPPGLRRP